MSGGNSSHIRLRSAANTRNHLPTKVSSPKKRNRPSCIFLLDVNKPINDCSPAPTVCAMSSIKSTLLTSPKSSAFAAHSAITLSSNVGFSLVPLVKSRKDMSRYLFAAFISAMLNNVRTCSAVSTPRFILIIALGER